MIFNHSTVRWMLFVVMAGLISIPALAEESKPEKAPPKPDPVRKEKSEDIWNEVSFESEEDQQFTEKQIQETLDQIKKENPQKAAEFEKLKNTDAEKFIAAIRDEIQKQQKPPEKPAPKQPEQEKWKEKLHSKHENFLAWYKKHYPEDHKELIDLRQDSPEKFVQRVMDLMKIYEPIQRMEKYNSKLAEAMKKNLDLQKQRDALLLQIRIASEEQQKNLTKELKGVVSQRFDTIVLEKQLQYEWLQRRLNGLTEKLTERAQELETLNKNKESSVQQRINELMERTENELELILLSA